MNSRIFNLLISLLLSGLLGLLFFVMASAAADGGAMQRICYLLGGKLPSGLIQWFTYFLFFFGLLEVIRLYIGLNKEKQAFAMQLLPEQEQFVLSANDIADLKLKMVNLAKNNPNELIELIKRACTKFRANKSVSETMEVVRAQTQINLRSQAAEHALIRYVVWAIPSVGFIGTVIGIAASLGYANDTITPEGISKMTGMLSIAFDTTLVALVLSIVLMYFFYNIQGQTEKLYAQMEDYVMENLVNRIYHREHA